ncbi:hypothetical protein N2152v2_009336 [Parachlorella kessleri]
MNGYPAQLKMYRLEVFVCTVYEAPAGAQARADDTVRFETLISARASGSWLLGPTDLAQGGCTVSRGKQQLVLHVLYTTARPSESDKTPRGSGSCLPTVLGVGRLLLPVQDARTGAAGIALQFQRSGCLAEAESLEPLAFPPIQFEALQQCRLSCPNSGVDVGNAPRADLRPVCPEPVSSQPVEGKTQAMRAQPVAERPPSRHACTQTADEKAVERRSPSQRHRAMAKSALHDSGAFYCPGCLERFMQLPRSFSRAEVHEAMVSCGCKDCSTQLKCGILPGAVPGVGLGSGAVGGWEGDRAYSSCGCHGSPTAAAKRKSSPRSGHRPESPTKDYSSSRPAAQLQQRRQLEGAGQAVAGAAVETGSMRQQGAIAAASSHLSSDGPQLQLTPEAAALQQLLTSLNLSSDWQAKLLGPLAAAAAASQPATGTRMPAQASGDANTAGFSQSVATLQSPSIGGCKAQPALSRQRDPAEGKCREETSQSSLGESSFASHSSGAGSRAATPRRHWVPAGAARAGSSTGSPAATPRQKVHRTKGTSCGEGSPQKVCPNAGSGGSGRAQGKRESSLGVDSPVAVGQPTLEGSAARSRDGREGPPPEKQRKPEDRPSLQGHYRALPKKADTMQDIISRNQQLLQLVKPGSGSGGGCHSDDGQLNSPRQDSHNGESLPAAKSGIAQQQGGIEVHSRTDSLLERAPPHKDIPLHVVSGQPSPLAERLGSFKLTIDGTSVVCTKRSSGNTSGEDSSGCQSARATQDASALGQPTIGADSSLMPRRTDLPFHQGQLASSQSGETGEGESAEDIIARLACYRSGSSGEEPVEPFTASPTDSEIAESSSGWAAGLDRPGVSDGVSAVGRTGVAAVVMAGSALPAGGATARLGASGAAEPPFSSELEDATASDVYEDDFEVGSDTGF